VVHRGFLFLNLSRKGLQKLSDVQKDCPGCLTGEEKARVLGLTHAVEELLPKIAELIQLNDSAKAKEKAIRELKTGIADTLKTGVFVVTGVSTVVGILFAIFGFLFKAFKMGIL